MNKDQIKGHLNIGTGKIKEVIGTIIDDDKLKIEGITQTEIGKVQKLSGKVEQAVKKQIGDDNA